MYLALYRKYRPRTFDEVISQEHITTTLKNQVQGGSVGHAYLFTGSRGTGKTSCAKILAMAVNCEDPQNGNPCLKCERCLEILNGTTTDIVEMDAASNNGVDDVRQLRDEVAYTPVSCKYRVYIIDEVHMLSTPAFNALLKTLEEPPSHVKFILATTELHKVPTTISSRCQRFEFHRVDAAESAERLLKVAAEENIKLDRDAAELIARLSDGGMRDALSILDRCVSAEDNITPQIVRDCVGVADSTHLFAFSEMIARADTTGCIRLLTELHKGSKDIALIISELTEHFRDMMLYKAAPADTDLLTALPDEQGELFRIAEMYTLEEILRCLTLLQQCADNIGKTKQRKTLAEMCFVKMCGKADDISGTPLRPVPKQNAVQYSEVREELPPVQPKPESEMTASERANAMRMRSQLETTAKLAQKAAPKAPINESPAAPQKAVSPIRQEVETPPPPQSEDYGFPPPPPPEEYGVPWGDSSFGEPPPAYNEPARAFSINEQLPGKLAEPTQAAGSSEPALTKAVSAPKKSVSVTNSEMAKNLASLTQEQWDEAVANSGLLAGMLRGSKIAADGDVLIVSSDKQMLLNNVKGKEIAGYEKALSETLGFPIHMKIVPSGITQTKKPDSPLENFLEKSRERGAIVNIKD